jgi:positive regulator of sigma E activity
MYNETRGLVNKAVRAKKGKAKMQVIDVIIVAVYFLPVITLILWAILELKEKNKWLRLIFGTLSMAITSYYSIAYVHKMTDGRIIYMESLLNEVAEAYSNGYTNEQVKEIFIRRGYDRDE